MLRLTTPGRLRFGQAPHFEITLGGAEANVAVMLAQLGGSAEFITRLPANELAERAVAELRGLGVTVDRVVRGGERMGVYFLEQGASQRAGKVIYDRAHSAIAEATPGDFDWPAIFHGARWFHWSGITPALSEQAVEICRTACEAARAQGLTVSFDLNFRGKLWAHARAGAVLAPLMPWVDLCITSCEEACAVFGIVVPRQEPAAADEECAARLCQMFNLRQVALTRRVADTADHTSWGAMLYDQAGPCFSPRNEIAIVDRVGAGDSFTGALIFALLRGDPPQRALDLAVAASALKHTIAGDFNRVTLEEVEALAAGGSGGRVQR